MAREHIFVVEDEEDIQELLKYNLTREGYRVSVFAQGEEGLNQARSSVPDLMLLDLMLPGIDGLEVCRRLKQGSTTRQVPIIMLTAKGEEADVVAGLELGADDYVTKPFSPRVLLARVRAVLRTYQPERAEEPQVLNFQEMTIHPGCHQVLVSSSKVDLTASEFRLLHMMALRPGWVFTRSQIVSKLHGDNYAVSDRAVDVHIVTLRKKLGRAADYIETVRGVGYRFKESASQGNRV
jgi:two-component system, OmpR family, alkaline phosphatase synthesis response regulator PhoP